MDRPAPRGKIRNPKHRGQILDCTGLAWGSISPTDLDVFLDFRDRLFVLGEIKYMAKPLEGGQRLALERLCDASQDAERAAVLLVASHDVPSSSDAEIDVANLFVREFRWHGVWRKARCRIRMREAIDYFRDKVLTCAPAAPSRKD